MLSSSSSGCSCASGNACISQSNSVCCSLSIGFQIAGGSATVMTYIVPSPGTYTVSGTTTSGNPPSDFVVFLNGSKVGSFNGSGGSISVKANSGDVIIVTVNWGVFYQGGTVLACIILPTPTPTSTPTTTPSTPTSGISLQFLIILIILIYIVLLTVILITYMK